MLFRAHRGISSYAPENTMPAFQLAIEKRFACIETDPRLTKDKKLVLLHDGTVNRTCRHADGTCIAQPVSPGDCTYAQLLEYDAGIAFGESYAGTKIPLLEDLLALAEGKDVIVALDKKMDTEELDALFDAVARFSARVSFSVEDTKRIEKILSRFPNALIDYDGPSTEEMLSKVTRLVKPENLLVWLYLDKPNFSWLEQTRKVSAQTLACAKRYSKIGIANINNAFDLIEAMAYQPYIVEV